MIPSDCLNSMYTKSLTNFRARSDSLQEIRQATQADDELALLKHTIMTGWPNNIKEIPQVLDIHIGHSARN